MIEIFCLTFSGVPQQAKWKDTLWMTNSKEFLKWISVVLELFIPDIMVMILMANISFLQPSDFLFVKAWVYLTLGLFFKQWITSSERAVAFLTRSFQRWLLVLLILAVERSGALSFYTFPLNFGSDKGSFWMRFAKEKHFGIRWGEWAIFFMYVICP